MNINVSIPLISGILYFILIILLNSLISGKAKYRFIAYLFATMLWSLSSFVMHGNYFQQDAIFVQQFIVATGFVVPVIYYYFISAYTDNNSRFLKIFGITVIIAIIAIDYSGLVVKNASVIDNLLIYKLSIFFIVFCLLIVPFILSSLYYIVAKYKVSKTEAEHQQSLCLFVGLAVVLLSSISLFWRNTQKYPIEHAGNIVNAAIISYAILKYNLFNIRVPRILRLNIN